MIGCQGPGNEPQSGRVNGPHFGSSHFLGGAEGVGVEHQDVDVMQEGKSAVSALNARSDPDEDVDTVGDDEFGMAGVTEKCWPLGRFVKRRLKVVLRHIS